MGTEADPVALIRPAWPQVVNWAVSILVFAQPLGQDNEDSPLNPLLRQAVLAPGTNPRLGLPGLGLSHLAD